MNEAQNVTLDQLIKLKEFLGKVSGTNEDTRFDPSQKPTVDLIINLMRWAEKTSIVEDFEVPFVHPMITIQKWSEEITNIVDDMILTFRR